MPNIIFVSLEPFNKISLRGGIQNLINANLAQYLSIFIKTYDKHSISKHLGVYLLMPQATKTRHQDNLIRAKLQRTIAKNNVPGFLLYLPFSGGRFFPSLGGIQL